ncbi:nitroreductase family protein [Actinoplanes sp. NPDC024001]|uniref:Acg family FMN-binding oxidoreductase n=1 Tax=Actinoplanes sp. NPDC024001 TaxID=3154598 RepID=UPI0033C1A014
MTVDLTTEVDDLQTPAIPTVDVLENCVRTAMLAPSLHNSQPWLFRIGDGTVDVYADPDRRLDVLDPVGRELMISVGAAVFTLRVSLHAAGYLPSVAIFPAEDDPVLVARVSTTGQAAADPMIERLAAAVPHRHTNRSPFAGTAIPDAAIESMVEAAAEENARLVLADPASRDEILALSQEADRRLRAAEGYEQELARWTTQRIRRHDGVPPTATGPWDAMESMPIRDFGQLQSHLPRPTDEFEPHPTIMVLSTFGDDRTAWVTAGQALQRVLLTATWQNLATTPICQSVEVPEVRERLTDTSAGVWAQMVLRVGYGPATTATPRRLLADVLLPDSVCT